MAVIQHSSFHPFLHTYTIYYQKMWLLAAISTSLFDDELTDDLCIQMP